MGNVRWSAIVALALSVSTASFAQEHNIQFGDFYTIAAVDAEDPRDQILDTYWYPASWTSTTDSAILWGRDYAPNGVVEGLVRLLDNRQANINAYTLSFATMSPRLVATAVCSNTGVHCWIMGALNGLMVAWPTTNPVTIALGGEIYTDDITVPRCGVIVQGGTFFVQKAFWPDGTYATCFGAGSSTSNYISIEDADTELIRSAKELIRSIRRMTE